MTQDEIKAKKEELDQLLKNEKYPEHERNMVSALNACGVHLSGFLGSWNALASSSEKLSSATQQEIICLGALHDALANRFQNMMIPFLKKECPTTWPEINRIMFNNQIKD